MESRKGISRRDFIKTSAELAAAVGIARLPAEPSLLHAQTTPNRQGLVAALGDTLIPSAAGDPGYKSLEAHGITAEVLKGLTNLKDSDFEAFEQGSAPFFDGKVFSQLTETQRADYLRLLLDGSRISDEALRKTLLSVYNAARRRVFTVYYRNFPENLIPRDADDIPVLRPGDSHQITNPNTEQLVTGWDVSRFKGPLTWEEEEKRREFFKKIDWVEEPAPAGGPASQGFARQEDFAKALRAAGSRGNPNTKYDVVIVGGGLSGCILAARIAEQGVNPTNGERLKVALIEWGPYLKGTPRPGFGHPLRRLLFTNVQQDFNAKGRYTTPWGFAKILGGSTMHFGAQAFHPFAVDYQHWQNETGVDWTEEEFRAAAQEVDTMFNVHPLPEELIAPGQRLFGVAARKLGYAVERLAHARKNCIHCALGCDNAQMCRYDSKMSALVTHVPIAERNGVEIIPHTRVEKVILEKRGSDFVATGVWAEQDGKPVRFLADKVILSASINANPWILYNSGVGPKEVVGKDLLVANENVGRHVDGKLRGPAFSALFPFPLKEGNRGMPSAYYFFQGPRKDGYDWLVFKEGICDTEYPDDMAFSELAPEFGWEHKQFMKTRGDHIASNVSLQYLPVQAIEGHVERDGKHVFSFREPAYAQRLIDGVLIIRDLYREMGASQIENIDPIVKRLEGARTPEQAAAVLSGTHQSGSCRAGRDPKNSVVNERFESHDVRNLLVCDLSVPPRVTLGNPGICMVAHVACFGWRRIVQDHFSRPSMRKETAAQHAALPVLAG